MTTHYELLGVPADADAKAISKAYRVLARQLHPDRTKDPDAQAQLARISDAYGVLSKPDRRAAYDATLTPSSGAGAQPAAGQAGAATTGSGAAAGPGRSPSFGLTQQRGADLMVELLVPAGLARTGGVCTASVDYPAPCPACQGAGYPPGAPTRECGACHGLGMHARTGQPCATCPGNGRVSDHACGTCAGGRTVVARRDVPVTVPAGVTHRQQLRLARRGAQLGTGMRGDLYIDVHIDGAPAAPAPPAPPAAPSGPAAAATAPGQVDERFLVAGNGVDVGILLPVSYVTLRLGGPLDVPTPAGSYRTVEVPAGSTPGADLRIPGAGLARPSGGCGDLFVRLQLAMPDEPPREAERAALLSLRAATPLAP